MFLSSKYDWLRFSELSDLKRKTYFGENPGIKDVANAATEWLMELFTEKDYTMDALSIFQQRHHLIADFIRYELFDEEGVIKLIFPRGMNDEERKKYEFITACWLLYMDSMKKKYGLTLQEYFDGFFDDDYLKQCLNEYIDSAFPNYAPSVGIPFDGKCYGSEDTNQLVKHVCSIMMKISFLFKDPYSKVGRCHVINGSEYFPSDPKCVQLEIKVVSFEDKNKHRFEDYLQYLVKHGRNGISNFDSPSSFWNNVVKLKRKHDALERSPQPDKILLLISLALGYDTVVYNKLKKLRDEMNLDIVNAKLPFITSKEERKLYNMLKDSHWQLLEARQQVLEKKANENTIPRRMLFNANKTLLLLNTESDEYRPIIELYGSEITEIKSSVPQKILEKFYIAVNENNYMKFK